MGVLRSIPATFAIPTFVLLHFCLFLYLQDDGNEKQSSKSSANALSEVKHDNILPAHTKRVTRIPARYRESEFIAPKTEQYVVEGIMKKDVMNGRVLYLVKWKGYPHTENTWVLSEKLDQELVDQFEAMPAQSPASKSKSADVKKEPESEKKSRGRSTSRGQESASDQKENTPSNTRRSVSRSRQSLASSSSETSKSKKKSVSPRKTRSKTKIV
ncbi:hypothetical protein GUITHDRAFT_162799 [Guillardia theta CCMP2712]|uniref:Chromo domain-containing protein n=1 Tax=Guillardia theta (strain CCMP2712) TaxID=905079 RepID=L1JFT8_GUITC|nr:hypothetical protein GUITHDRAFT_162799 [Guillardia theta CCMP2712]EKX47192.1 hypothetical protein GUITHDRAFT_162799 [Guillardia theta CCMP2712]|eukprot:XP_005834172.1 hypothetical protein GUITHDRAFT_162799 [Guillardia theta CCMP2712]